MKIAIIKLLITIALTLFLTLGVVIYPEIIFHIVIFSGILVLVILLGMLIYSFVDDLF